MCGDGTLGDLAAGLSEDSRRSLGQEAILTHLVVGMRRRDVRLRRPGPRPLSPNMPVIAALADAGRTVLVLPRRTLLANPAARPLPLALHLPRLRGRTFHVVLLWSERALLRNNHVTGSATSRQVHHWHVAGPFHGPAVRANASTYGPSMRIIHRPDDARGHRSATLPGRSMQTSGALRSGRYG